MHPNVVYILDLLCKDDRFHFFPPNIIPGKYVGMSFFDKQMLMTALQSLKRNGSTFVTDRVCQKKSRRAFSEQNKSHFWGDGLVLEDEV